MAGYVLPPMSAFDLFQFLNRFREVALQKMVPSIHRDVVELATTLFDNKLFLNFSKDSSLDKHVADLLDILFIKDSFLSYAESTIAKEIHRNVHVQNSRCYDYSIKLMLCPYKNKTLVLCKSRNFIPLWDEHVREVIGSSGVVEDVSKWGDSLDKFQLVPNALIYVVQQDVFFPDIEDPEELIPDSVTRIQNLSDLAAKFLYYKDTLIRYQQNDILGIEPHIEDVMRWENDSELRISYVEKVRPRVSEFIENNEINLTYGD